MARSVMRTFTLSTTAQLIVAPSAARRTLVFSSHATSDFSLGYASSLAFGSGLTVYAKTPPVQIESGTHGDAVTLGWFAVASAGTPTIAWLEVLDER